MDERSLACPVSLRRNHSRRADQDLEALKSLILQQTLRKRTPRRVPLRLPPKLERALAPFFSAAACAFWYVDALACVGRTDDALRNLEQLLAYSNHLGIFSEDATPDGSQWGNFPQTYSHVGLINAVCRISRKLDRADFM